MPSPLSQACNTPTQYKIPIKDASCGLPNTPHYKSLLETCAQPVQVTPYNNDCALYAPALHQSIEDLTDCLYEAGVKWEDVWCFGGKGESATASSYSTTHVSSTSTSTRTKSVTVTETETETESTSTSFTTGTSGSTFTRSMASTTSDSTYTSTSTSTTTGNTGSTSSHSTTGSAPNETSPPHGENSIAAPRFSMKKGLVVLNLVLSVFLLA